MENVNYVAPEVEFIEEKEKKGFAVSQQEGSTWDDM